MTVWSGGCSGSGEVVPTILFMSREKERVHEHLGNEKNLKRPLERRDTDWNTVTTGRAPRRRSRPELEKKEKLWRLSRLEGELGGALGSQECGERCGVLNLNREGSSTGNFEREARRDSSAQDGENARRCPCWCLRGGGSEPGASTSCGDAAGKQLRACTHARGAACATAALDRGSVILIGSL